MSCSFGVLVCTVSRAEPCLTPELLDRSMLGFALEQVETFSKRNRAATSSTCVQGISSNTVRMRETIFPVCDMFLDGWPLSS